MSTLQPKTSEQLSIAGSVSNRPSLDIKGVAEALVANQRALLAELINFRQQWPGPETATELASSTDAVATGKGATQSELLTDLASLIRAGTGGTRAICEEIAKFSDDWSSGPTSPESVASSAAQDAFETERHDHPSIQVYSGSTLQPWPGGAATQIWGAGREPSGIIWHPRFEKYFWVDDGDNRVYVMDADGSNSKYVELTGGDAVEDLEDICYVDAQTDMIYVVNEHGTVSPSIYEVDAQAILDATGGASLAIEREFSLNGIVAQQVNDGPEALTFVPDPNIDEGGLFYVGNQWEDKVYILKLSLITGTTVTEMSSAPYSSPQAGPWGAVGDLGGADYDRQFGLIIWINDQSNELYWVRPFSEAYPATDGWVKIFRCSVPTNEDDYEGICIGPGSRLTFADDGGNVDTYPYPIARDKEFLQHVIDPADPHSQYSLVDGTKPFTGTVGGIDPTDSADLATKEYVDTSIGITADYFFNDTGSDIGGIYYDMTDSDLGGAASTLDTAGLGAGDGQALVNFATLAGFPGVTALREGIYSVHVHAERTVGTRSVVIYAEIYYRELDTSETLLTTTELSGPITAETSLRLHAVLSAHTAIADTDRMVVKFFANIGATGANATVRLHLEGTHDCHLTMPTTSDVLSNVFVRKDLFDANTILAADADDTPAALAVAAQRIVGRAGGNIAALTAADVKTLLAIDHGADVTGRADDDHSGHPWLNGRSGGQTLIGGTDAGDDLTLETTSNGTKGTVFVGEAGDILLGDGALRTMRPDTSDKIDRGSSTKKFKAFFAALMDANEGGVRTQNDTTELAAPADPTDAELDAAFGTPAAVGDGFLATLDHNAAGTNFFLIGSDGTNWWYQAFGDKAV